MGLGQMLLQDTTNQCVCLQFVIGSAFCAAWFVCVFFCYIFTHFFSCDINSSGREGDNGATERSCRLIDGGNHIPNMCFFILFPPLFCFLCLFHCCLLLCMSDQGVGGSIVAAPSKTLSFFPRVFWFVSHGRKNCGLVGTMG